MKRLAVGGESTTLMTIVRIIKTTTHSVEQVKDEHIPEVSDENTVGWT